MPHKYADTVQVDGNTALRTHNVYSRLQYSPWSVNQGLSVASVGRGSGGRFVDPLPEELLHSCKLAGRGKASTTAFTMCRISSVVKGSFFLHFSAGKDPEDVSLLSLYATAEGGVDPSSPAVCVLVIRLLLRGMLQAELKFSLLKFLSNNVAALRIRC